MNFKSGKKKIFGQSLYPIFFFRRTPTPEMKSDTSSMYVQSQMSRDQSQMSRDVSSKRLHAIKSGKQLRGSSTEHAPVVSITSSSALTVKKSAVKT